MCYKPCNLVVVLFSGYYQCFANNQYGLAMSQVALLQKAVLGTFATLSGPQQYTANVGDYLMVGSLSLYMENQFTCCEVIIVLLHPPGYITSIILSVPFSMYFQGLWLSC